MLPLMQFARFIVIVDVLWWWWCARIIHQFIFKSKKAEFKINSIQYGTVHTDLNVEMWKCLFSLSMQHKRMRLSWLQQQQNTIYKYIHDGWFWVARITTDQKHIFNVYLYFCMLLVSLAVHLGFYFIFRLVSLNNPNIVLSLTITLLRCHSLSISLSRAH